MAVKAPADRVVFYNYNRPDATPPLIFSDFNDTAQFSCCIWAKVLDVTTPDVLFLIQGTLGSQVLIEMAVTDWRFVVRSTSTTIVAQYIGPVVVGKWTVFYITKNLQFIDVLVGYEDLSVDPYNPVHLTFPSAISVPTAGFSLTFDHIAFVARNNVAICNYKYWPTVLSLAEVNEQINRWDTGTLSGDPNAKPIWASTLRTPGDISSIANPYTSTDWAAGHGYTAITPNAESLTLEPDPAFLAHYQPCPTWLYPPNGTGFVFYNPGNTPLVATTYKSTIPFAFVDKGSLPVTAQLLSLVAAEYYAYPFTSGTGPGPTDSWPLYTDENGNELVTDLGNPANRFQQDTGVAIPLPFNIVSIYAWKFGGQFTWVPAVPQQPAGTGNLGYPRLLITYVGTPSGKASLPVQDLVGLFAIRRDGVAVDQYNRGVQLKIPDPTIRTAFLGE